MRLRSGSISRSNTEADGDIEGMNEVQSTSTTENKSSSKQQQQKKKKAPPKKKSTKSKKQPTKKKKTKTTFKYPPKKPTKEKDGDNNTYTTVAVGLSKHCSNNGMKKDISEAARFISQAANMASFVMKDLLLLRYQTTDDTIQNEIDYLLQGKYHPTKQAFAYNCMNKNNSVFNEPYLVPHAFERCDFSDLSFFGRAGLLNFAAKSMTVNIINHLKNWDIYQSRAVSTQVQGLFDVDMTNKKGRKRCKRICTILMRMINGTAPIDEMEECNTEVAVAIVDAHRDALGFGSYVVKENEWKKYSKTKKAQRKKKGKGRKAKIPEPVADMSDKFTEKCALATIDYFIFCLGIQEKSNAKLFNILPCWKHQQKHATIGNETFFYLIKRHGDEDEIEALKGYHTTTFCNHPLLRQFWLKYFPKITKYERSNQDLDMKFQGTYISSDGVQLSLTYRMTYHNLNKCRNERIETPVPLCDVPTEETEECNQVIEFGMYEGDTFREVRVNDESYSRWAVRTVAEGDACEGLRALAFYLAHDSQDLDDEDMILVDPEYSLERINDWWTSDESEERINKAHDIIYTTTRGTSFTLAYLRGEIEACHVLPCTFGVTYRILHISNI